jgi:putative ABC transport system ATP-binding protein
MIGQKGRLPAACCQNLSKVFGANEHQTAAVRDVTLQALPGELILLLGPSGSGKTTLLTLIAGLIRPTSGRVLLFGKDVESYASGELQRVRARKVGFVFQTFLLIDSLTALENVEIVLRFNGTRRRERRRRARELLRQFGVEHLEGKFPQTMSQGEKQRVAVARAIGNDAALILADEPTGSLETKQGFGIIELLRRLAKEQGKCVIVASHDLRLREFADRIFRLEDGRLQAEAAS